MNIIFLDVDGVLNSMPYCESLKKSEPYNEISDFHLQMLAKIYHTCHAKIVLSSTWRTLDDESDKAAYPMYQYLAHSLAKYDMKIISKTPVLGMNRPLEIKTWLEEHSGEGEMNYIILDDDFPVEEYAKYGIERRLIHTKYFCSKLSDGGLQKKHVEQAIRMLQLSVGKQLY